MKGAKKGLLVVTALGKDRPGLVAKLTEEIARLNANILDIEQSVVRGLFSIFMLVDLSTAVAERKELEAALKRVAQELNLQLNVSSHKAEPKAEKKRVVVLTILGKDKPGIVYAFSSKVFKLGANIERIKMIAQGELFAMEMFVDLMGCDERVLREEVKGVAERIGVDVVVQPESSYRKRKRLIVFDMDGTLIETEVINELAKVAGCEERVSKLTELSMKGELDYEKALRERVKLLEGLPISVVEDLRKNLKLTTGGEELILALKQMGFKLTLITGGFEQFASVFKEKYGFDYVFANKLEVKEGKLTGRIEGEVIDAEAKARLIRELAEREGISPEEIVAIGDGANDRIMLQNVGLGIAFNPKHVLKQFAAGVLTKDNLRGLIYCLGLTREELEELVRPTSPT